MAAMSGPVHGIAARISRGVPYALLWVASIAIPLGLLAHITALGSVLPSLLGIWIVGFPLLAYRARLERPYAFGVALALAGVVLASVSFVTGRFNGLTDEPYMMPHFVTPLLHGHDPYATSITVTYSQYGSSFTDTATYVYLPELLVLQPFVVSYQVYAIAAWAATVYLVRSRPWAVVALAQPYVALLAANGFNDFPVLLLLTVGFVGINGHRSRWAEVLALGAKQFANVIVVAYYLVTRRPGRALVALGVSVAFIAPFFLWNPGTFLCRAVVLWPSACGGSSSSVLSHVNYWVWPVWCLGVFFEPLREMARRRLRRDSAPSRHEEAPATPPGER